MSCDLPAVTDAAAADSLAALAAALDGVEAVGSWRLGEADLLALVGGLSRLLSRAGGLRLALVAEADERDAAAGVGAASTAGWLRVATGQRPGSATRDVRLARALADRYRATGDAVRRGRIDAERAEVIRDCLDRLPAAVSAETMAQAETEMLGWAADHDASVLSRLGRHLHTVLDPDGPGELERAEDRALHGREVHLTPLDDGTVRLRGLLDGEGGAALLAALDPLAAPRPSAAEGPDLRSPARRRADALLDLVSLAVSARDMPRAGGGAVPTLTVTVSYDALRDQLAGLLGTGAPVSPATVRRLSCDAGLVPAVLGSESRPLDIGRRTRIVPPSIRRALELRDQHCVFPGCDRPPPWCHAHHVQHWAEGGSTSLENLALLCGHHHRVVHNREGWTIVMDGRGGPPRVHAPPWAAAA